MNHFVLGACALLFCQSSLAASLQLQVVDDDGLPLAEAVAALLPVAVEAFSPADVPTTASVDQRDRQFEPYVSVVRSNTLVSFPNSDDIRHHVYSFSPAKRFELKLYHGSMADPVLFEQAGTVVLGCNIHDSMLAYIYVVDSEYFALSGEDGQALVDNVPPGDYVLQIQHPRFEGMIEEAVTISGMERLDRPITLSPLLPDPRNSALDNELEALFGG